MAGTAIPYQKGGVQVVINTPAQVQVEPRIFRCRLTGLLFDTNKTFLLPMAFRGMKVLKKLFAAHSNLGILVNGHTDRVGGPDANLKLSEERARSIQAFLRDDVDFWLQFYKGRPGSAVWGTTEDKKMLEALGAASVKDFQAANGVAPANGQMTAATRRKLVEKYMAEDGSPLPAGAHLETHGCGEFHNEVETADDVAEPKNRRVEIFLFDPEIGPRPRPTCPGPAGCDEYFEWKKQTAFTVDLDKDMGALTVQVTDKSGKPIPQASVHISGPLPEDGTTNDSGVVQFQDVIPGDYKIFAEKNGFEDGSAQVKVGPGSGGGVSGGGGGGGGSSTVVLQSGTGDLTVVVTDGAHGTPVAGAKVDLETPTGPQSGLKTDASGVLHLAGTPAGEYQVTVSASGFDAAPVQHVTVGPNSNAGVSVKLMPAVKLGSLTIVVVDGSSSKPVPNAVVDLATPSGPHKGLTTDKNGHLDIDPTEAGAYTVTVTHDGFSKSTTNVTVGANSNTGHTVKLTAATGALAVLVKDRDGAAVPDAVVQVVDLSFSSTSDKDGKVDFGDVATGTHTIKVEKAGFGPDFKKVGPVEVKTTVQASSNNPVTVTLTAVPVTFDIPKFAVPKVIAPGAETVKITYEVADDAGALANGKLEILDSKDKVLSSRDLTADERKKGPHEIAWKGETFGTAPAELPGGFITVEHSPYKLRLTGSSADGKTTVQKNGPVEVKLAEILLELGPKTYVTDARDQRLHDTLGGKIPDAGTTKRIELLSNLFKTSLAEMNASNNTSFTTYRDDANYGYGDGARIPIVAKVHFEASDGKKVVAAKAWGKRRLLWDWEEVAENTGALDAKVKTYVDTAKNYDAATTKPKGKLTHKDRGGKRSADGTPAVFEKASTFDIAAGTKRVWAAFTSPADGGADDGKTGVLFRPGRQSGDAWKVTVHFEPDPAKDLDVETAPAAKLSKATGTFEVWRKVEIVKYIKKTSTVPNVGEATIQGHYSKAFLNLTFPATKKSMTDAGEPNYNTTFTAEYATIVTGPIFPTAWVDPAVNQHGAGDHAVEFRQFAAFKSTAIANRQAQLVAGGMAAGPALTQATTDINNALNTNSLNSVAQHATHCSRNLGDQIAKAIAAKYVSTSDGITLIQFVNDCNLVLLSGWVWYGFAPSFPGQGRTKSAFLLYGVPSTHATNNEDTVAHEVGHLLFLVHSPAPTSGPNAPGGSDPAAHDQTDTGPCLMSYDHSNPHHFCGLCNLRLRGWDHTKLDKDGSKNKKP